jgi:hypothetical protein
VNVTQAGDSAGNGYTSIFAPVTHTGSGLYQQIYYAKGIKAAAAGSNMVTVTLDTPSTPLVLLAVEYSGLDSANPFDTAAAWGGAGTTASTQFAAVQPVTTTPRELIFGAGITAGSFSGPGSTFTSRKLTSGGIGIAEDRVVSSTGSYIANAPLAGSAAYIMQVATFR